jgi:hypothetical protein
MMLENKYGCVPVVDGDRMTGNNMVCAVWSLSDLRLIKDVTKERSWTTLHGN